MTAFASAESVPIIPFDEIAPGGFVRFTIIDGTQFLSICDLIMILCAKNNKAASKTWERISDERKEEVSSFCRNFKFPGQGQTTQPVITFPGAIKLAMLLPGECAKKNRLLMANIIVRYYAGDPSLIMEVEASALSDAVIPNIARTAILGDCESTKEECNLKRKREELELLKLETEITVMARKSQVQAYAEIAQAYTDICSNSIMDEYAKNVFKEAMLSTVQHKCIGCNDNDNKSHDTHETAKEAPAVLEEQSSTFTYVESARWPHTNPLVDKYTRLDDMEPDNEYETPPKIYKDKELQKKINLPRGLPDRYGILGFQYYGPRITSHNLSMCKHVQEAYGIKKDGKQFLILIMCSGHEIKPNCAWIVLYRLGLLARFYLLHAISLYTLRVEPIKDDVILDTIKQPADDKWSWHI